MRRTLFIALVLLSAASSASAVYTGDTVVVLPVVGRFPGAFGTQWRTDVFVSNHSTVAKTITLTFYVTGGSTAVRSFAIEPFAALSFPDVVLNTFGLATAAGELEVSSSNESTIDARARIYNNGNAAGEFGQNVPGLGLRILNRQSYLFGLSGLSGANGSRVNVGVTNPTSTTTHVTMRVTDKNNDTLHLREFDLAPHQNVQFNDIVALFGIAPQGDIQVELNTSETIIYGYASEVRNDTGDAVFSYGTSPNS
jgi:hypothetical protein